MSDEQAIRNLVETWLSATAAGNVDEVLKLMSEDVVFLVVGQPPMRGRQAFETGLRSVLKDHRVEGKSDIQEIVVSGNLAYCWNHLSVSITPLQGGSPVERTGNVLSILRKGADGSWVIIRDANLLGG